MLPNDYSVPRILGYYIKNIISIDLAINCMYVNMITLLNRGWGGEMITALHRGGVYAQIMT